MNASFSHSHIMLMSRTTAMSLMLAMFSGHSFSVGTVSINTADES